MSDELPFDYGATPANPAAPPPRPCRHPREYRRLFEGGVACGRCGKEIDPERAARGRRANRRGRRAQKANMEAIGLTNLPGNLKGLDGQRGMFKGESKSGRAFPLRLWRWLNAIPAAPGQVPILVVSDTPGPGHKTSRIVVMTHTDFMALHGEIE